MSKSFDFCIEKVQDPDRSTIADRDYSEAFEVPLYTVSEYFKDKKAALFYNDGLIANFLGYDILYTNEFDKYEIGR